MVHRSERSECSESGEDLLLLVKVIFEVLHAIPHQSLILFFKHHHPLLKCLSEPFPLPRLYNNYGQDEHDQIEPESLE